MPTEAVTKFSKLKQDEKFKELIAQVTTELGQIDNLREKEGDAEQTHKFYQLIARINEAL